MRPVNIRSLVRRNRWTIACAAKVWKDTTVGIAWGCKWLLSWIIAGEINEILELGGSEIEAEEAVVSDVVEVVGPQLLSSRGGGRGRVFHVNFLLVLALGFFGGFHGRSGKNSGGTRFDNIFL